MKKYKRIENKADGSKGYLNQVTLNGWVSFEQQKKMKLYLAKIGWNFSDWLRGVIDDIKL